MYRVYIVYGHYDYNKSSCIYTKARRSTQDDRWIPPLAPRTRIERNDFLNMARVLIIVGMCIWALGRNISYMHASTCKKQTPKPGVFALVAWLQEAEAPTKCLVWRQEHRHFKKCLEESRSNMVKHSMWSNMVQYGRYSIQYKVQWCTTSPALTPVEPALQTCWLCHQVSSSFLQMTEKLVSILIPVSNIWWTNSSCALKKRVSNFSFQIIDSLDPIYSISIFTAQYCASGSQVITCPNSNNQKITKTCV